MSNSAVRDGAHRVGRAAREPGLTGASDAPRPSSLSLWELTGP